MKIGTSIEQFAEAFETVRNVHWGNACLFSGRWGTSFRRLPASFPGSIINITLFQENE
jgi:hypothetical protein